MAFLWSHPNSKYFIARFIDKDGKRRNRSTKSTNRKEAQRIADAYEEAGNKRRTARQVRTVIAALHKEITGGELASPSFKDFSKGWLERKKAEVSVSTNTYYTKVAEKFSTYLGDRADAEIAELTAEDIVGFRNKAAETLASKTVNHDLKCLRMIFRAAEEAKAITENPCEFVTGAKAASGSRRRPFTLAEMQAVLSVADDEWKSLIRFGLYIGQRLGDLATLTWENVDLQRGEIRLVTRKTGKVLIVPISDALRKHIESLPAGDSPDAPIHPRAYATVMKKQRVGTLSNQFAGLLAQAGLREKLSHRKTADGRGGRRTAGALTFHCLRHTAVSLMKDAGIPESVVMALVGHDSKEMSKHYTTVGLESMHRAAATLPNLG